MNPASKWMVRVRAAVHRGLTVVVLATSGFAATGQLADGIAPNPYENRIYHPAPAAVPGLTGSPQPRGLTFFSGNVGAPGVAGTPSDGTYYLVQSGFGQPTEEPRRPDFLIGEAIVPDPVLGADLTKVPLISPPVKAFYLADLNNGTVIASEAGYVEITWKRSNNSPVGPVRYLIDRRPVRPPVGLYHTHLPGANFETSPLPAPQTKAPLVDMSGASDVIFHWNTALPPDDPAGPFLVLTTVGQLRQLYARDKTGIILLEYRQAGALLGIEIVELRSPLAPDGPPNRVDLGHPLLPYVAPPQPVPPVVTEGLGAGNPQTQFVYQHNKPASAQNGELYAVRSTLDPEDIEVYWMTRSLRNIVWPYELHRYTAGWPVLREKYQVYVRGSVEELGPDVRIPADKTATLMPFQEPPGHASPVVGGAFSSTQPGWSLLKYDAGDAVGFQAVRSMLHDDPTLTPASPDPLGGGATPFEIPEVTVNIGEEITELGHAGPRPGYIHVPEGDRYDWEIYDGKPGDPPGFKTQQIYAVNTGVLEVWWSNVNQGVQWPSSVKRYRAVWPQNPGKIIIASLRGGGAIDPVTQTDYRLYYQNDPVQPGYNPNDEHALIRDNGQGESVFALRDDLGSTGTSLPYALLKYRDDSEEPKWKYTVYRVIAEEAPYFFNYAGVAGTLIQPPFPLSLFQAMEESHGVSGPYWRDRKQSFWARAAGDNGGPAQIVMRFFYPVQPGFFFPGATPPAAGAHVPWLDRRPGGIVGVPTDIRYTVNWPSVPELRVGESLVKAKFGLPDIGLQTSVEVIYEQSEALDRGPSVELIDPTREYQVDLAQLPPDVTTETLRGLRYFTSLPPHLRTRLFYDPVNRKLKFRGDFIEPPAGEYYLLLNVISARDKLTILGLSSNAAFQSAVNALSTETANVARVLPDSAGFDSLALTAGLARDVGYVTLAFANSTILSAPDEPISLAVIKVTCPIYRGEIKVIESDNPFDEKLTLRHSGDFAGKADQYVFEWRTLPPTDGLPPTQSPNLWAVFSPKPVTGLGALDLTIEGAGLFTLTDNYFVCRYRPVAPPICSSAGNPQGWSDWTEPMLAEGWIKRVLRGINPFEQKFKSYADNQVNTIVSMISQAGLPFVGAVPLNQEAANQLGLLEVYETVLRRGMSLSVNGLPAVNYGPANDALLLAAGRLADLYMLLGNEAFADAADPTIAFGTDGVYGSEATSIHCFMNQVPSLIEEELALLRGRDDALLPPVTTYPFYNRLIWNFTSDINGGEVAYALNYNIRNESGDVSGTIDEADAKRLYPQGHGDSWGHYLSAIKNYYRLLRNPNFTWVPRIEAVLVGGVPVSVDFLDERKFAAAAAARARTGAEIINLTYREAYVEDPEGQWQGYQDENAGRAWGLADWGSRAGQGAYLDWLIGNALLPAEDLNPAHTGIQKVDRTTVTELRDIVGTYDDLQLRVDMADGGLNPLGLAKNVVPFDIDPSQVSQGKTHFEQVYERALRAMNNAIAVFNHANNSTQLLRRQSDNVAEFQQAVIEREVDFKSRLIEIFGYPYPDDIGPTGTYPSGYDGPDLYHYDYVDSTELLGETPPPTQPLRVNFTEFGLNNGELVPTTRAVTFNLSLQELGLVKPTTWTQRRRAVGEIQMARSELLQAKARFDRALVEYRFLTDQIQREADLLAQRHAIRAEEISVLNLGRATQANLSEEIEDLKSTVKLMVLSAKVTRGLAKWYADGLPKVVGLANDAMGPARLAITTTASLIGYGVEEAAYKLEGNALSLEHAKEDAEANQNIQLKLLDQKAAAMEQLEQLVQLIRKEPLLRLEVFTLREAMLQTGGRYLSALARGQRLVEDRLRFRSQTAAQVQEYRYKDMAFRIFRNDALQKYRAQFDLAAMYVFLAARAYDFETNLSDDDSRGPGTQFLTDIVRSRSLGQFENGQPQTGSGRGDPGLADPIARMVANWDLVLKGQLGFNNPQTETGRFSLRSELFRIQPGAAGSRIWRETMERHIVANLLDYPEFKRYCIPFQPQQAVEPAIVIPFSTTINFGQNFFGWPAGGGDNDYDSTHFATKIRSVGVWFANYNNLGGGMINTPRVYLVPVGNDVMRSPTGNRGEIREWKILDQKLPIPFPLSVGALGNSAWIPQNDTLADELGGIRQFARFRAYHDSGSFNPSETVTDSRLIGRSVWNTRWLLIIPGGTLHNDRNEGIQRFINGALQTNGERDGNGVLDLLVFFQTYAYAGN